MQSIAKNVGKYIRKGIINERIKRIWYCKAFQEYNHAEVGNYDYACDLQENKAGYTVYW